MIRKEPKGVVLIIGPWNYPVRQICCVNKRREKTDLFHIGTSAITSRCWRYCSRKLYCIEGKKKSVMCPEKFINLIFI